MTYTHAQLTEAINRAREQTDWRSRELVADTAAMILAGHQAPDDIIAEAKSAVLEELA